MKLFALLLLALLAAVPCRAQYSWLSGDGLPLAQDSLTYPFMTGDTVSGRVHCNGPLAISGHPVFYGQVSMSAPDFIYGPGFAPVFHGGPPIFNAPIIEISGPLTNLRNCASVQGHFFSFPGHSYRVVLEGSTAHIYKWRTGTPYDSTDHIAVPLSGRIAMFFDGPVEMKGAPWGFRGQITIGSSHNIRVLDNVAYADAYPLNRNTGGRVPIGSPNILGIASERDILIANTPANGRWNSCGRGLGQNNLDSTSIFITAALWAGGSFTFEQQNDPDSGYVCDCIPDERGVVYFNGSVTQGHHGALRRSTNRTTGYLKQFHYDLRSDRLRPPCWPPTVAPSPFVPDTLDVIRPRRPHFDMAPNPFNLTATLRYSLPEAGMVRITLFDVLGRSAKEMDLGMVESGEHSVQLQAVGLPSGIYFVRLHAAGQVMTQKVMLIK